MMRPQLSNPRAALGLAVESYARATGRWWNQYNTKRTMSPFVKPHTWPTKFWLSWLAVAPGQHLVGDARTAAAWLLCLGAQPLDVGPCPACEGTKTIRAALVVNREVLYFGRQGQELQDLGQVPCPTCTTDARPVVSHIASAWGSVGQAMKGIEGKAVGKPPQPTGRSIRPLSLVIVDAQLDRKTRDALAAEGERLQVLGDPLGEVVAWSMASCATSERALERRLDAAAVNEKAPPSGGASEQR